MAYIGCDVVQWTAKHSELGTFTFYPKAGENAQIDVGGYSTESDDKGVTGAGESVYKIGNRRWVVELPPIAWKRKGSSTLADLDSLNQSFEEIDCTFTLADGTIYVGRGRIVDAIKGATYDATIPVKLEGGGKLRQL